jgi:hypothetical protein
MIWLLTFAIYVGSAIYTPGITGVTEQFGVSSVAATLGLTLFVLGYGLGSSFSIFTNCTANHSRSDGLVSPLRDPHNRSKSNICPDAIGLRLLPIRRHLRQKFRNAPSFPLCNRFYGFSRAGHRCCINGRYLVSQGPGLYDCCLGHVCYFSTRPRPNARRIRSIRQRLDMDNMAVTMGLRIHIDFALLPPPREFCAEHSRPSSSSSTSHHRQLSIHGRIRD